MTDEWKVVAKRQDGATRVERKRFTELHRLVTSQGVWPLDETEGEWWRLTAALLSPAMVDYHLGNLALAHSMCLPDGKSFAQQAEEGVEFHTKLRGGG